MIMSSIDFLKLPINLVILLIILLQCDFEVSLDLKWLLSLVLHVLAQIFRSIDVFFSSIQKA